jgi:ribosomal-protein-alanine N-acetyltransferase
MSFHSKRLHYTLLRREDAHLYVSIMMDQEVMRYITGEALKKRGALKRFRKLLKTNKQNNAFGTYAVFKKDPQEFIGIAKFVLSDDRTVEIGYALLKEYWGLGYGTEISLALIDYAQDLEEVTTLEALVSPQNMASKRILEKCNFKFLGKIENNHWITEVYRRPIKAGPPDIPKLVG